MPIKVKMYPHKDDLENHSSGIAQVVLNYFKYLPKFDIELVNRGALTFDLSVGHAAAIPKPDVHHSHGLLWTAEFPLSDYAWEVNSDLVQSIRGAKEITVPSQWVAEPFRRDFRLDPHVIPHGVVWDDWQEKVKKEGFVLWAKNRINDGLNAKVVDDFANAFPQTEFVTTFGTPNSPSNVRVFGTAIPHHEMKLLIQAASCVIMTDRETWGILAAEAMAAGTPVLSVRSGAVPDFMPHGVAGYCYEPGNFDDAKNGLAYCLKWSERLGANGKEVAKLLTWDKACEQVADVYRLALNKQRNENYNVGIVIPCYNDPDGLEVAIQSATNQDYKELTNIIIVDDGSTDKRVRTIGEDWAARYRTVEYTSQPNRGVSSARNRGLSLLRDDIKFVCFLDSDDRIEPGYISRLVGPFMLDRSLGITYTGVRVIHDHNDRQETVPWDWPYEGEENMRRGREWPKEWDYDEQLDHSNQIPTCCLIKREALDRLGGYRDRYCPDGAGSEDAELFLRLGAYGWKAHYISPIRDALFVHRHGSGNVSGTEGYEEPDWRAWHPWVQDGGHPFVSYARSSRFSHPVRSYEQPTVSVIIPVGSSHEHHIIDALDSLEAQTFRYWEVIVAWDSAEKDFSHLAKTYPYVKWIVTHGYGAGAARNLAASQSSAPFIAFLDADDYYSPTFLEKCLKEFEITQSVVYTNFISKMSRERYEMYGGEIIKENKRRDELLVLDHVPGFDKQLAMMRPEGDRPYVWAGVTVLLPKLWHNEIGGFDEALNTWEDCDYLLRLAWAGYDFSRIKEPLWLYNFKSGHRREYSAGVEKELIKYMQDRWDEWEEKRNSD